VDRSATDWKNENVEERWQQYFALWEQAARLKLFDSLAHPDLPKKFGYRSPGDLTATYQRVLRAVKAADVAIEVSTAGLRKPCREIYPSEDFLRIAHQFEIPITFGSDAHIPEDTGADFDQAVALARRCGYDKLSRFTLRKRDSVPLPRSI